jgi:hypothetical protein
MLAYIFTRSLHTTILKNFSMSVFEVASLNNLKLDSKKMLNIINIRNIKSVAWSWDKLSAN